MAKENVGATDSSCFGGTVAAGTGIEVVVSLSWPVTDAPNKEGGAARGLAPKAESPLLTRPKREGGRLSYPPKADNLGSEDDGFESWGADCVEPLVGAFSCNDGFSASMTRSGDVGL